MYRNDSITADQIEEALYKRHDADMCFRELRLSSGFANQSRVDFLAMNVAPSTGNKVDAYEIKTSRSDFRRDSFKKQRGARLFSDRFWYIAPVTIIPHEEVPDWAGLLEVDWHCYKYASSKPFMRIKEVISAPKRDKDSPSWGLVASLVRNSLKEASRE
jgi:hypothetical protein